ncbi:BAG family molecular chaperone regulator 3-like [Salvia miltiorrhiza]|uniref:BAG family molecular chaperone regulator 3-like n=1 Tax=Salvia miltiorrhiza TaxID=226208 RepID=UPI0025AC1564|nr:BAG family molecular chaperone regulator 3-like [Salvia miltiorrhiza]XP_057785096.1 BAG family molecular chaperone regulator 3-like [Salvia miltiorrhiza]
MMRMRTKNETLPPDFNAGRGVDKEWELRPGGMLVQKRTDGDERRVPPPTIRVRVKYGSIYHELRISSQSTFGELKKMLSGPTGLHHQDQKLFYKDKERNSSAYLDSAGVKDKSKLVLEEDAISKEKRFLEMRKNAKMEKAAKTLSDISLEVDRLAAQASALETVISKGGKLVEKDILNLIELLMNQLLKLDGVVADGDVKLQRKMQVRRIQKLVEKLDLIKLKNSSMPSGTGNQVSSQQQKPSNGEVSSSPTHQQPRHSLGDSLIDCDSPKQHDEHQPARHSGSATSVVITTQWETFDSTSNPFLGGPSTSSTTEKSSSIRPAQPSFSWNLL